MAQYSQRGAEGEKGREQSAEPCERVEEGRTKAGQLAHGPRQGRRSGSLETPLDSEVGEHRPDGDAAYEEEQGQGSGAHQLGSKLAPSAGQALEVFLVWVPTQPHSVGDEVGK